MTFYAHLEKQMQALTTLPTLKNAAKI